MAQLAHEAGFIDEPDPAVLAEALGRDLSGQKVLSIKGERFERMMELQVDREFERYAALEEDKYFSQLDARTQEILDAEDISIPMLAVEREGELVSLSGREAVEAVERGEGTVINRSARKLIEDADSDTKAGDILSKCLTGG